MATYIVSVPDEVHLRCADLIESAILEAIEPGSSMECRAVRIDPETGDMIVRHLGLDVIFRKISQKGVSA